MKKTIVIMLSMISCFLFGCSQKHFDDGFLVLGATCYNISQNNSYSLERAEFDEVLNIVCKKVRKITHKETVNQIKKDFDGKVEYIVMMRYAAFTDDRPATIEITKDKILRCFNEYYMLDDNEYGLLTAFLNSSMK